MTLVEERDREPGGASSLTDRAIPLDGAAEGSGGSALTGSTGTIRGGLVTVGIGAGGGAAVALTLAVPSPGGNDEGDSDGPRPRPSTAAATTTTTVPATNATTLRAVRVFDLRFEMIVFAAADTGGSSAG